MPYNQTVGSQLSQRILGDSRGKRTYPMQVNSSKCNRWVLSRNKRGWEGKEWCRLCRYVSLPLTTSYWVCMTVCMCVCVCETVSMCVCLCIQPVNMYVMWTCVCVACECVWVHMGVAMCISCECVCVCMCMYPVTLCVRLCLCPANVFLWRTEVDVECLVFLRQVPSLNLELTDWLDWLCSKPPGSSCHWLSSSTESIDCRQWHCQQLKLTGINKQPQRW